MSATNAKAINKLKQSLQAQQKKVLAELNKFNKIYYKLQDLKED